jgi:hypothetical protein
METLLISHFYNEEFLLPHWIKHHYKMFDHAVMIDYESTDNSVEIIKTLAPNWEIRPSRNKEFDAPLVDEEVMDIEREFTDCWKVALNITEFIIMPNLNLKKIINRSLKVHPTVTSIACHGVWLVDKIENMDLPIDDSKPILSQRHWGTIDFPNCGSRNRLIHCLDCGQYNIGRHKYEVYPLNKFPTELYCIWLGWSPYFHIKSRKMQIKDKIPLDHFAKGWGVEHNIKNLQELDNNFLFHSIRSNDLYDNKNYKKIIKSCFFNSIIDFI